MDLPRGEAFRLSDGWLEGYEAEFPPHVSKFGPGCAAYPAEWLLNAAVEYAGPPS
ncbi:hypothetical protein ACFOSC_12505 [Streptantibioticus rubrisoli]|uniref:Uncharacterized protein n=1 Tax=Streptantibioticus rubrisoli TaxID=1387313 RepID=A0ABT1PB59_9ACTN|nr:hypothetical protein [Streptantibioticus rubrisoli]MCQ4041550.1 hypothetical protein [Streptantibioticus rubrisoli]